MTNQATLNNRSPGDVEGIYEDLNRDGAVVIDQLFDNQTITKIRQDIEQALAEEQWCNTADEGYGAEFFGKTTKRLHGVLQYSNAIESCLMHPLPQTMAQRWLGHKAQFSTGEVMAIGTNEVRQDLHTDAGSWRRAGLEGELLFSMTIALTDFTADNGATVIAPGSHRWEAQYEAQPGDFTAAAMTAGSALFYSGNVLHGGGSNTTNETRIGLYMGYIPFWLQPLENPVITHPQGFLDHLAPQTQAFINYHPQGFSAVLG